MEFFSSLNEMTVDERRVYLQEGFILDATEQIWAAMSEKGVTRKELADTLGMSAANISRLLNGGRNMTLRTLSDIADALNCSVRVQLADRDTGDGWVSLPTHESSVAPNVVALQAIPAANDWTPLRKAYG